VIRDFVIGTPVIELQFLQHILFVYQAPDVLSTEGICETEKPLPGSALP